MGQRTDFQVYQEKTFEYKIVENEIHIEILVSKSHPLLAGHEREPFAELKKELLQVIYDRLLQIRFMQPRGIG